MSHRKILKSGFFPESKLYEFSLFPGPQSSNQTVSYQYHSLSLKYPVKSNQQSKLNHTLKKRFLKRTNWFSVSQKDTVDTSSTAVYYQLIKLDDHRKDTENYDEMLQKGNVKPMKDFIPRNRIINSRRYSWVRILSCNDDDRLMNSQAILIVSIS